MLRQQIVGVINLSVPVIVLFYLMPGLLTTPLGPICCSVLLGAYIWFLNYRQYKAGAARLLYAPSGDYKKLFESWIQSCGVDRARINLRYAYTSEQFALTMGNTVVIDSICYSVCADDVANQPVKNVFKEVVEPRLSENAKKRLAAYKEILTPEVQEFLFKHEIGHIVHKFAFKKLWLVFVLGVLSAYAGILTAKYTITFHPLLGIFLGMFVGGVVDILLTYASNYFFKYFAEKNADFFAARHSSVQHTVAAAEFFAKLQEINQTYKDNNNFVTRLPLALLGYASGQERKAYLLKFVQAK